MGKLTGQVAVVTGGGRGLGRAFALRLADLGASVAVVDQDLASYTAFEAEEQTSTVDLLLARAPMALGLTADVGDATQIASAIDDVVNAWGRLDVIVCNAGGGSGPLDGGRAGDLDLAEAETVLQRNLMGTINTCVAAAVPMRAQQSGKIVTVASRAGILANRGGEYAHYGVSKAGVIMYTHYLANHLGPEGITANCIAPGFISTGRLSSGFSEQSERIAKRIGLRRWGTVDDCANVIEFLATDLSDYVSSAVIPVDGASGLF